MRQKISLIANSGLQFHSFNLEIDPNSEVIRNIGFWEKIDYEQQKIHLEYAHFLQEFDTWVSQRQLEEDGFLLPNGQIREDVTANLLTGLSTEKDVYSIGDIEFYLEHFENKWLPLPYFYQKGEENFTFGPTNWVRLKLIPTHQKSSRVTTKRYRAILLVDTSVSENFNDWESPYISETDYPGTFQLCKDKKLLLRYLDPLNGCEWVQDYLDQVVYGAKERVPKRFPVLKHLGFYIYFIRYLSEMSAFPTINLHPNVIEEVVDVDMVLDIGNSRTCGILMESPRNASFSFDKVKRLLIRDLSDPTQSCEESVDMRLAFNKADFGEIGYKDHRFVWPSFVRIGKEAARLIYHQTEVASPSKEALSNHSSPKRYLWDTKPSKVEWRLIGNQSLHEDKVNDKIYIPNLTEQFDRFGNLANEGDQTFGVSNFFSRKSLMTFVFLEILSHAWVQINSFDFRETHGDINKARKIRNLVITCPTGMTRKEQIALRGCAEEAVQALRRFYQLGTEPIATANPQPLSSAWGINVIPEVRDLKKDPSQPETKKDWMYDEATCCQLVFMYAEVSRRYLNMSHKFFELYGKVRKDLPSYDKQSVTIGSIDIGAGTTDLMICAYQENNSGAAVLTPYPLFWESFNLAGDQLTKEIVKQIILEGEVTEEKYRGCTGGVYNAAKDRGIFEVESKINNFFGPKSNEFSFRLKQDRKRFNTQVSVPMAEFYLEHAQKEREDIVVDFNTFFPAHKPNEEVLRAFEQHFGFKFEEIKWRLSTERVNQIVQIVFEPLLRQICSLLFIKGCDFVLLAGRPTSLKILNSLILKYYPVPPDRIISLNEYRVGHWYPFQDGNGYFTDKKSIVAVGAAIALYGGRLNALSGFRLETRHLKKRLISTADYFGIYDPYTTLIQKPFLSPERNIERLIIDALPVSLGFKKLNASAYPGRMIYKMDYDYDNIRERKRRQNPHMSPEELDAEVAIYCTILDGKAPFKVRISREFKTDKEQLVIESIEDRNRDDISPSNFVFALQTLDNEVGYWLDTGEFEVKIRSKI